MNNDNKTNERLWVNESVRVKERDQQWNNEKKKKLVGKTSRIA